MLEVKLICIGKLKEKYWRDAVQEYAKRLSAFCRFQIIELNEARLPQDPNAAEIAKALGEESKAILAAAGRSALYTLCIEGKACLLHAARAADRRGGRKRGEQLSVRYRFVTRAGRQREAGLEAHFHVADDVSAPAGTRYAVRAAVPRVFHQRGHEVPQII